jgi:hypothetical protein
MVNGTPFWMYLKTMIRMLVSIYPLPFSDDIEGVIAGSECRFIFGYTPACIRDQII